MARVVDHRLRQQSLQLGILRLERGEGTMADIDLIDNVAGNIAGKTWNRAALVDFLYSAIEFSKKNGVQMYVGEFGAVRWSKGADRYFSDLISIFEEYYWVWCYQACREWEGWSAEHDDNRANTAPVNQETDRLKVLRKGFALNAAMK